MFRYEDIVSATVEIPPDDRQKFIDKFGELLSTHGWRAVISEHKPLLLPKPRYIGREICPLCGDDGLGSERWGGHNPACPRAKKAGGE